MDYSLAAERVCFGEVGIGLLRVFEQGSDARLLTAR